MESVAFIQWCLEHLNYWTITLLMTIESSFIPFPSEVIIPPAAYKAAVNDELNIYLVVLFATIGADIGALINYYLAKWLGRPIIYKFANSRIGHMCLIDEAKVQHAESYFDKHGALSTFIGRLIPAVRQLISIPAGLARMKMHTFLLYTTIGAGLWNTILAIIGYYLSTVPGIESEEQLIAKVTEYSHEIGYCFIAIGIFINSAYAFEQRIGSHDIARLHKHDEIAFHGSHACRKALIDAKRLVGFHHVDTIAVERIFQIGGFTARRSGINQNKLPAAIALKRNRVHKVVDVMRRSVVKHANNAEKRLVIEAGCHLFEQIRNIGTMLLHKPFMIFGVKRRARCLLVEFGNESFKGAIA